MYMSPQITERVTLTPAERAVMVETAETIKVLLDVFIEKCKDGTGHDAINAYSDTVAKHDYVSSIFGHKVTEIMTADHKDGHCEGHGSPDES